jgi:hypothetical protein
MSSIRKLVDSVLGIESLSEPTARPVMKQAPVCEALEGRQLLNGAWRFAGTHGMWDARTADAGTIDPAYVHRWNGIKSFDGHHGLGQGFEWPGKLGRDLFATSPQAKGS